MATQNNKPFSIQLIAQKKYFWCSCGQSETQPFCDGSHKNLDSGQTPLKLEFNEDRYVKLCGCKKTKNPPYCDMSHLDD